MSMNTVPERLAALRAAMKANGVDVYLIPVGDPHASEYMQIGRASCRERV